jgi:hypothetical protein
MVAWSATAGGGADLRQALDVAIAEQEDVQGRVDEEAVLEVARLATWNR